MLHELYWSRGLWRGHELTASEQSPAVLARGCPMNPAGGADEGWARTPMIRPTGRGGGQSQTLYTMHELYVFRMLVYLHELYRKRPLNKFHELGFVRALQKRHELLKIRVLSKLHELWVFHALLNSHEL